MRPTAALFAVESMPTYGELSGRKLEDMMAGARVEVADHNVILVILCFGSPLRSRARLGQPWGADDRVGTLSARR